MSHWTKFDHVTFLIAFVLSIANLFFVSSEVGMAIFVFLLLALIYDIHETKRTKK